VREHRREFNLDTIEEVCFSPIPQGRGHLGIDFRFVDDEFCKSAVDCLETCEAWSC
jgi:hypothetical protein